MYRARGTDRGAEIAAHASCCRMELYPMRPPAGEERIDERGFQAGEGTGDVEWLREVGTEDGRGDFLHTRTSGCQLLAHYLIRIRIKAGKEDVCVRHLDRKAGAEGNSLFPQHSAEKQVGTPTIVAAGANCIRWLPIIIRRTPAAQKLGN